MSKHHKDSPALSDGTHSNQGQAVPVARSRPAVRVEFPKEGDTIAQSAYTFQIAASAGTEGVEICINEGEWLPCRESLGLWWYDWSGFDKGSHQVAARTRMGNGLSSNSAQRRFMVE